MDGHDCILSETNSRDWVALCQCGWIGAVCQTPRYRSKNARRLSFNVEVGRNMARNTHAEHLELEHEAIAALHAIALDNHAEYLRVVTPTVRRVGRFGNG